MTVQGDPAITGDEQQRPAIDGQPADAGSSSAAATPSVATPTPSVANPTFMSAVWSIVWKDLTMERHTRQLLSVMLFFSLVTVVVYNFALYGDLAAAREVSAGLLWITILLAGTLGLNRSLMSEQENRSLEAILMAPIDRSAIYLGKVISVATFTLLTEAILVPIFIAFFNRPFWRPQVLLILFVGTIGYVAVGVLITSMSVQTRTREVLLPVLLLPLSLPAVLAAAQVTAAYTAPVLPEWSEVQFAFVLVLVYTILMLTAGFLTYQYVVEE